MAWRAVETSLMSQVIAMGQKRTHAYGRYSLSRLTTLVHSINFRDVTPLDLVDNLHLFKQPTPNLTLKSAS